MEASSQIALLLISLLIGFGMQFLRVFPENTYMVLSHYLIYVALPAVVLIHIPAVTVQTDLIYAMGTSWIVFLMALLVFKNLGRWMNWSRYTTGCLILTAGLGNTAFLGFPLIEALYGAEGLRIAMVVDQTGTFVIVNTLGIITASVYASGPVGKRKIAGRIIRFPPFIVFVLALAMNLTDTRVPDGMLPVLEQFGATLAPIALITVGLQMQFSQIGNLRTPLFFGLLYTLVVIPALMLLLYVRLPGIEGLVVAVSVTQAAMPPMVTSSIIATTYGLNPRLASLMLGMGTLIAIGTLAGWYLVLRLIT